MTLAHAVQVRSLRSVVVRMLNEKTGSARLSAQTLFNEYQKEAIEHEQGPMLCIGTPGSGKTTVIVNRIVNLIQKCNVDPKKILVITFTRDAASMMEERFKWLSGDETAGVRFGTFHSFFFWIIRTAYSMNDVSVIGEDDWKEMLRGIIAEETEEKDVSEELLLDVMREIDLLSSEMISPDDYYSESLSENSFRNVHRKYSKMKKESGRIDFNDMMDICYRLLLERKDIRERLMAMYPYIMVDEFQDTNKIQYEILRLITKKNGNIFVVGDDDQSIYGFRGARPDILLGFEREYEGVKKVILPVNYRCPAEIVGPAGKLIEKNHKRFQKKLESGNPGHGIISLMMCKDPRDEAEKVVKNILADRDKGTDFSDIAVLYRTSRCPIRLMFRLREHDIPFSIKDGIYDIFSNQYVSIILDYLAFASGDHRRSIFLRIMNKPVRYISRDMLTKETVDMDVLLYKAKGKEYVRKEIISLSNQMNSLRRMNPYAGISFVRRVVGIDEYARKISAERNTDPEEVMDILDEFMNISSEFETVDELFGYIDEYRKLIKEGTVRKREPGEDTVSLMTFHGGKGLEWNTVHIIECVDGETPHKKAKTVPHMEEERRMFYVAVTRAGKELFLYVPKLSGSHELKMSRFITEMQR